MEKPDPHEEFDEEAPTVISRVKHDLKTLSRIAAKYAFVIAIICHFLPPHYHVICDAIKACLP